MKYTYRGDRLSAYRGCQCDPVLNAKGKCIRGRNGNMLVKMADGTQVVVLARLLRKNEA